MPTETYTVPTVLTPGSGGGVVIVLRVLFADTLTRQQLEQLPDLQAAADQVFTVPEDPNNRDWQAYQRWLAAGNTPVKEQLPEVKARRIQLLRQQLFPYVEGIHMVAQGVRWRTTMWGFHQHELVGPLGAGDYLTGDGKAPMVDAYDKEQRLSPTAARKTAAAAQMWLFTAYREYLGKVNEVNACATNEQVAAVTWTPEYSPQNPFNTDGPGPSAAGFDAGFDIGYG